MTRRFSLLCLLLVLPLAACDDKFGPQDWSEAPDTTVIYSLSRPEHLGRASAFDFAIPRGAPRAVESAFSPGQWDIALVDEAGGLAFAPAGAFQGQTSRAAIATMTGVPIEEVKRAPRDDDFVQEPVILQIGPVYIARSRGVGTVFGTCTYYGKFEVLEVNQEEGWIRFRTVVNPNCNNRDLVPPDSD